jgi:hypothetical protein
VSAQLPDDARTVGAPAATVGIGHHVDLAVTLREVIEHLAAAFEELDWPPPAFTGVDDLGAITTALGASSTALGDVIEEALLQLDARTSTLVALGSATDELALRRAHRSLQIAARLHRMAARCIDSGVDHLAQISRSRAAAAAVRADEA